MASDDTIRRMSSKPTWRRVFDRVERAVGAPLEDAVASTRFVEVVALGMKARRAVGGTARRAVDGVTGTVLRAVNIPTREDVRALNANMLTLVTEVRALEKNNLAAIESPPAARTAKAKPAEPQTGRTTPAESGTPDD